MVFKMGASFYAPPYLTQQNAQSGDENCMSFDGDMDDIFNVFTSLLLSLNLSIDFIKSADYLLMKVKLTFLQGIRFLDRIYIHCFKKCRPI